MTTATRPQDPSPWLERIRPVPATRYDALNPSTRLVLGLATAVVDLVVPGLAGPLVALAVAGISALVARNVARVTRPALLVAVPLGILVVAERLLLGSRSGGAAAASPLDASLLGLEVLLRVGVLIATVLLFADTTDGRVLALDLERRGISRRLTYGTLSVLGLGPAVRARIAQITAAQRARGLRVGGGPFAAFRARLPLVFPTLVSALGDFAEGSLALESRASGRHGARTLLWWPPDRGAERALRWILAALILTVVLLRLAGRLG